MKTILLETNAICNCLDKHLSGLTLAELLSQKSYIPIVNIHTTYELARTFLNSATHGKGKKLFTLLQELNPIFSCFTSELLKKEINKLRNDIHVDFFCDSLSDSQIRIAVKNLSNCNFLHSYETFIREREKAINVDQSIWDKLITIENKSNLKSITYENLCTAYLNSNNAEKLKDHIKEHTNETLTNPNIMKFLCEMNAYPALLTLLRIDLYLNFSVIKNGSRPAKDKIDDFRHLIDASYCSLLVTNDEKLTSIAHEICPAVETITFEKLVDF